MTKLTSTIKKLFVRSSQADSRNQLLPLPSQRPPTNSRDKRNKQTLSRRIFWFVPAYTLTLFLGGIALASGHYAYLSSVAGKDILNQAWVNRFSLAFSTLVKIFLTAALEVAVCQLIWRRLWKSERGTSIDTIDALFSLDTTVFSFFHAGVWRDALVVTLLAVCIWLMNFIPIFAPSALSIGLVTSSSSIANCTVPTLNLTNDFGKTRLQREGYTSQNFSPSQATTDLIQSIVSSGSQATWPSPCGPNCSYTVQFEAPSLRCTSGASPYDPAANWTDGWEPDPHPWWGGFGDSSNVSAVDNNSSFNIMYSPIYEAQLNYNTSKFWVGISTGLDLEDERQSGGNRTVAQFLNLTAFFCDIMNTTYDIQVTYVNDRQAVKLNALTYVNNVTIPPNLWQGGFSTLNTSLSEETNLAAIASLYVPLYNLMSGQINRDPREGLGISTNIGQIPELVRQVNISSLGEPTQLALPDPGMLPHLEQLSHNISLSLMANPQLAVTGKTTTSCSTSKMSPEWRLNAIILAAVYGPAVLIVLVALVLATFAIVDNGIVRDKNFSALGILTTRDPGLSQLVKGDEDGALPLSKHVGCTKLRFGAIESGGVHRQGFVSS